MDKKSHIKLNLCVPYDGAHHTKFRHFSQNQMNVLLGDNALLSVCGLIAASKPLTLFKYEAQTALFKDPVRTAQ